MSAGARSRAVFLRRTTLKYPKTFVTTPDDTFLAACALVPADHQHAYEAVGHPELERDHRGRRAGAVARPSWRSGHGPRGGITIDGLGDLYLNSPAVGSRFCSEHTVHTAMRSSLPW